MLDLPSPAAPMPALSSGERLRARLDMLFVDHGVLRSVYLNAHPVTDELWRAAQPGPRDIAWAARKGFKTILNLRGRRETCGSYILERAAVEDHGLTQIDFPIRSRSALEAQTLIAACDLFDRLEYPVLMHCKSGADRTGFMATLYLHLRRGVPIREAMAAQLSLRYGHVKQAKTGVLDWFFERYLADTEGTDTDLRTWIETRYDRVSLDTSFKENWLAGVLVNKILRRE